MTPAELERIVGIENTPISIVPFKSYFLKVMDLVESDAETIKRFENQFSLLDAGKHNGFAYTVIDSGKPILCFGLEFQWDGVATAWLLPDKVGIRKNRIKFHKGALNYFGIVADSYNQHRIEVTVNVRNPYAEKWIKSMGFDYEGTLRQYGTDKTDHKIYARLF